MQEGFKVIGDVRGAGLFIGVELVKNRDPREPFNDLCEQMILIAPEHGLYLGESMPYLNAKGEVLCHNVVKIKPLLIITDENCDFILEKFEIILKEALNKVK
ncbi:MAG: aminotransferase class III-fold pyridoxal phosphate-dependent enzyme [Promethearchaeota archaeon]